MRRFKRIHCYFFIHLLLLLTTATFSSNALANPQFLQLSDGSTLTGSAEKFTWTSNSTKVDRWWFYFGTSVGGRDIANSGDLGLKTEYDVIGIPVDGSKLYGRLWYHDTTRWHYIDSTYTAASLDVEVAAPAMISPADNSELAGAKVDFQWSDNNTLVNYWWAYIGSSKGGKDIYDSRRSLRTKTSVSIDQLPVDGSDIYFRLWYHTAAERWQYEDYIYSASDGAGTDGGDAADNLALIKSNATRSTMFDDNEFYNVPAKDIAVSDLTLSRQMRTQSFCLR